MKKLHAVLLVLGVVFLTYLVWTIGVGELWHQLTLLGWGLIPLILIEGVADLAHTVGWRRCLSGPHRSLPLGVLFCIRMAGFAINYLTPTASLGGEVTKAALLASNHRGPEAASGVLIGKLCFAFAHLLFVVVGSTTILWHIKLPRALWVGMLISSALLAGGMVAFLLIQKYGKLGVVVRWLVARKLGGRLLQRAARDITEVDEALMLFYRKRPWDLPLGVCWHLLGNSVGIFQTWFFFHLLNEDASLVVAAGAWVLSLWFDLLAFAVPLNLGTLEGSRIVAFKAVGYDALLGMTYGVALRLSELFWAGFGLVSHGLLSRTGRWVHMNLHAYQVELFDTASQIPDDLWEACFQPPAEGRWWYENLDQSGLGDQFTFFYGLIKHLGRPVGIAPVFTMDLPVEEVAPKQFLRLLRLFGKIVPSVLCQRTLFVGSPVLDEGRVGLISHVNRRAALLSLQLALEKKADELRAAMIIWKDFPESSSADLNWLSHRRRLFRVISLPNTVVEFPSLRKEDYFAAMKGSRRHNLKKKLRRSRVQVALGVEIFQRPDSKTLDDIFGLFWQTYEKSAAKFARLNREFFELIAEKPASLFIILREPCKGEMIAFMLCLDMGERLINLFIGMDYSRPKEWMLYFRLWEAAVDLALSRGFTAVVSGRSSYAIKIEMGHKLVPLNNYCQHRNIFLHSIYRVLAQRVDWASLDEALARFLKAHPESIRSQILRDL